MSLTWLENTPERRLDLDTTRSGPGDRRLAMLMVPSHLPMSEPSLQGLRLDTSGIRHPPVMRAPPPSLPANSPSLRSPEGSSREANSEVEPRGEKGRWDVPVVTSVIVA